MEMVKKRFAHGWINSLKLHYESYKTENFRCKIVNLEVNQATNKILFKILIKGVKSQIVSFDPEELVVNDKMLNEFSASDVRAITFMALKNHQDNNVLYSIFGQDFNCGKTTFLVNTLDQKEFKMSADKLYNDNELLKKFSYIDIKNIITTAIQEQAIEDLG